PELDVGLGLAARDRRRLEAGAAEGLDRGEAGRGERRVERRGTARSRDDDTRLAELTHLAHRQRAAHARRGADESTEPARARPRQAAHRAVDHAADGRPALGEPDHDDELATPLDELARAVERIDEEGGLARLEARVLGRLALFGHDNDARVAPGER